MVSGIKVTKVTTRFDNLLKQRLLRSEIELGVKNMVAAAINLLFGILALAVGREISLGPKAVLANNVFHPLEPSQILRVVIGKIK